jgi:hypothetical protein
VAKLRKFSIDGGHFQRTTPHDTSGAPSQRTVAAEAATSAQMKPSSGSSSSTGGVFLPHLGCAGPHTRAR